MALIMWIPMRLGYSFLHVDPNPSAFSEITCLCTSKLKILWSRLSPMLLIIAVQEQTLPLQIPFKANIVEKRLKSSSKNSPGVTISLILMETYKCNQMESHYGLQHVIKIAYAFFRTWPEMSRQNNDHRTSGFTFKAMWFLWEIICYHCILL